MAFSEGLSDTGELTGRGNPFVRGAITGVGTFVGGILHTLPFLIPHYHVALIFAHRGRAFELVALAWLRWRFFDTSFAALACLRSRSAASIIAAVSAALGTPRPRWFLRPAGGQPRARRGRQGERRLRNEVDELEIDHLAASPCRGPILTIRHTAGPVGRARPTSPNSLCTTSCERRYAAPDAGRGRRPAVRA